MTDCANCGGSMAVTGVVCGADSSSTSRCQTCGRTEESGWGGTRVRFEGRKVGREEFAAAIREQAFKPTDADDVAKYPGGIVHSYLGGIGADWSVEGLVLALDLAETVEWIPAPISGHQLRVVMKADDGRALDYRFDVKKPTADLPHVEGMRAEPPVVVDDPAPHPHGSAEEQVHRMITTRDEQGVDPWVLAEEVVKFIRKDERERMQDFDWRSVVDRASAVAVGAGAPDDGATLPEQVEWLAGQLHGPALRPTFAVVPDHVVDRHGNVWRVVRDGGMLTRADFRGIQSIGVVTGETQHGPMRAVFRAAEV